jgi:hypothetical protein|tara:strand:- start:159 stop:905 length:747 start_codon:yes stop_codon:yes gene_type:complete
MYLTKDRVEKVIRHEHHIGNDFFDVNKANFSDYSLDEIVEKSKGLIEEELDYDFEDKTCAIVGSGPTVFNNEYGEEIDKYDYVVRFNLARTKGFEKNVGTKSDFRVVSTKSYGYIENPGYEKHRFDFFQSLDDHIIIKPRADNMWRWFVGGLINNIDSKSKISVIDVESMNFISREFKHMIEPSCGLLGIIYFLNYFKVLDLYGFDFYETTDNIHYFEKVNYNEKVHSFNEEKDYCLKLLANEKIRIH